MTPPIVFPANTNVIFLENATKMRVFVAINFLRNDGKWATWGWYKFEPNEKAHLFNTKNRFFFYYAESEAPLSSRVYWKGTSNERPRWLSVSGSERKFPFRLVDVGDRLRHYTIPITESNGTRETTTWEGFSHP